MSRNGDLSSTTNSQFPSCRPLAQNGSKICGAPIEGKIRTYNCVLYRELVVDYCESDQIGSRLGFPQREQFPAHFLDGLLTFRLRDAQSRKMVRGSAVPRRTAGLLGFRRNTGEETRRTRKVKSEKGRSLSGGSLMTASPHFSSTKTARMISFLRAHKRVITFSSVALGAYWLAPSWGEAGPLFFLLFFAIFVMLITSQLFWIQIGRAHV